MFGSSTLMSPISGEAEADEALRSCEMVARGAVAWMARVSGRAAAILLESICVASIVCSKMKGSIGLAYDVCVLLRHLNW